MKKSLLLVLFVMVMSVAGIFTNANAQDKPVVLLDTSGNGGAVYAWNGGSTTIADLLRTDGFELRQQNLANLTDADLEGVDILLLLGPSSMNVVKKEAIIHFIQAGGGVMVGMYPGYGDATNINSLIGNFGLNYDELWHSQTIANLVDGTPLAKPNPVVGGIGTNEINHFTIGFAPADGEAVALEQNGKVWIAISKSGNLQKGRLIVIGYDYLMINGTITNRTGNANFSRNMFQYLKGGGTDLTVSTVKPKGGGFVAGNTITVVIKGKNISDVASDPTNISITLVSVDQANGGPGDAIKTLGKADLSSQASGKKYKVKKAVKIPGNIEPGEYYLLVVVDPSQTTKDVNRANNSAVSKKIVIQ